MLINKSQVLIFATLVLVGTSIVLVFVLGQEAAERAVVTVNDIDLPVRIADNPWERRRGLAGYEAADIQAQGMLFIFPDTKVREFWMKGMELDLDILWIKDGIVVGLETKVLAPVAGQKPERVTSSPIPVDLVLELPAGYAAKFDLRPGVSLKISLP